MQRFENPELFLNAEKVSPGQVTWQSPSNIAIIKYWGKYGDQLPQNPSFSLTLDKAFSKTSLKYRLKQNEEGSVRFFFEGKENPTFGIRIKRYVRKLDVIFPFLQQLDLDIYSENSFPHSSGIASSASGLSALALCLCSLEENLYERSEEDKTFFEKASFVARLGSGSACRSVYDEAALWGYIEEIDTSSDFYAVSLKDFMHPVYHTFKDSILIVSKTAKTIPSSHGHQLMESNPFAVERYEQARRHLRTLLRALKSGDTETFGLIAEAEALTLHAMMMCSSPPYILMKPETMQLLQSIKAYRKSQKVPIFFTMDAGPNVHLLYPEEISNQVQTFISEDLLQFCEGRQVIHDNVGRGPIKIT